MGVCSRTGRAAVLSVGALWAVMLLPAMLGRIQARQGRAVPVLLVHGKDDTVVPYEQSEIMLKALTRANKKVELVTMKKEDHWLSRGETRLLMLQSSMAFLKANNPPD